MTSGDFRIDNLDKAWRAAESRAEQAEADRDRYRAALKWALGELCGDEMGEHTRDTILWDFDIDLAELGEDG